MKTPGAKLAAAIKATGLSQRAFAAEMGVSPRTLWRWVTGKNEAPYAIVAKILKRTGHSADWLLGLSDAERAGAGPVELELQKQTFTVLPMVGRAAAGPPRLEEMSGTRPYAFRPDFLRRLKVPEKRLGVWKVIGDSMEPTLHDDAIILVDREPVTSLEGVRDGRLYLVQPPDDEGLTVKRVYRDDGKQATQIVLVADNPAFRPRAKPVSLREHQLQHVLLGRVLWVGQREE